MNTLLLGSKPELKLAYPQWLRDEMHACSDLHPVDVGPDEWRGLGEVLAQTEVIFATWGMPPLDEEFLAAAPRLRAVFYAAGSVKGFATPLAFERDIAICSAWQANAIPVAEYSLATIILSLKGFWSYLRRTPERICKGGHNPSAGAYRSKVGLVSLGAIGQAVARRLACLELEIFASDPHVDPRLAAELGVSLVPLERLFATCDVVSLHAPVLPETTGMIDGRLIESMPYGATLINTARGALIRENELCEVLRRRPDLHAVLDVTDPEPPQADSALLSLPNVILTPHIAGSKDAEIARMGRWMVDEYLRFAAGEPLRYRISEAMLARMA